jgi:hypothetical protein
MATSTPEYQDADEAAQALTDVCTELNAAEDLIDEGEYEAAATAIRLQMNELSVIIEWCNKQDGDGE